MLASVRALSSAGERSLHTGEVAGSIPAAPTIFQRLIGSCRQYPAERYANMPLRSVENPWTLFADCPRAGAHYDGRPSPEAGWTARTPPLFEIVIIADRLRSASDSEPRSGRGGRRFKSCHSDQYLASSETPIPTVSPTDTRRAPLLPPPVLGQRRQRGLARRFVAVRRALYRSIVAARPHRTMA